MLCLTQVQSRRFGRKAAVGLSLAICFLLSASGAQAATSPAVVGIYPTPVADLILLSHGFNAGLREGMVCRISRDDTVIAEVLLVDIRPTCSSALILSLAARQAIQPGDMAAIKVLKS